MHEKFSLTKIYTRKPINNKETKYSNSKFEKKKIRDGVTL
jgi:hypothetical protein